MSIDKETMTSQLYKYCIQLDYREYLLPLFGKKVLTLYVFWTHFFLTYNGSQLSFDITNVKYSNER